MILPPLLNISAEEFYSEPGQAGLPLSAGTCREESDGSPLAHAREEGTAARPSSGSRCDPGGKRNVANLPDSSASRNSRLPPFPGGTVRGGKQEGKEGTVLGGGKPPVQGHLEKVFRLPAFSLTGPVGHHILYALWSSTTRYTTGNMV